MKVALVKQLYDTHGPWASVPWSATSPTDLLKVWPGRALFWSMTVLLQADWYVIPQQTNTWYTWISGMAQPGEQAVIRKYTKDIIQPQAISWDRYDLVISLDACLRPPRAARPLFAYYTGEHFDVQYACSRRQPARGYDLFLAHMLDAPESLHRLPQAVACPYLWDSTVTRSLVQGTSHAADAVFVEWRTLALLSGDRTRQSHWAQTTGAQRTVGLTEDTARQIAARLEGYLGLPVRFRLFRNGLYSALPDPPRWGDAFAYLTQLADCRYYVSLFAFGPGQALVDAASVGALVFGTARLPYHRLICHPACLCADLEELPGRVRQVKNSPDLQAAVIACQEAALRQHFATQPQQVLAEAVARKRRGR